MKFRVEDKVRIKKDFSDNKKYKIETNKEMEKYAGKIMTIRDIKNGYYQMQEDIEECIWQEGWKWSEDMFEDRVIFTKSDLKDGDIVTYRNGEKRTVINNKLIDEKGINVNGLSSYKENLTEEVGMSKLDIIKVERSTGYETVFERKEEILDEVEKEYLRGVIRPFRKDIEKIRKNPSSEGEYLIIIFKDDDTMSFKNFKKGTMYKNMKIHEEYTLEELGL